VSLSTGSSFGAPTSFTPAGDGAQGWYLGDFNGDNRTDIMRFVPGVSGAQVFLSNGSSFVDAGSWTGAGNDGTWVIGDFNGDGRSDIARNNNGVGLEVFVSTGSSFQSTGTWTGAGVTAQGWYVGDLNGDGRDDIFRYNPGVSGAEAFLSNGSAFVPGGSFTGAGNEPERWNVGDFNGDGMTDVFRVNPGVSGADMFLSNSVANDSDQFWFLSGYGKDEITDFHPTGAGHGLIVLDHLLAPDFASVLAHSTQVGANTVITFDANTTLTLDNVLRTSLVATDFQII
jgi:hypothetical protein